MHGVGLAPVSLHDDVGEEGARFGVVGRVRRDVVEGGLKARDRRDRACRRVDGRVERGELGLVDAIAPFDSARLSRAVVGDPLAVFHGDDDDRVGRAFRGSKLARESDDDGGRFGRHSKAEGPVGAPLGGEHQRRLEGEIDPRNGKARAGTHFVVGTLAGGVRRAQGSRKRSPPRRHAVTRSPAAVRHFTCSRTHEIGLFAIALLGLGACGDVTGRTFQAIPGVSTTAPSSSVAAHGGDVTTAPRVLRDPAGDASPNAADAVDDATPAATGAPVVASPIENPAALARFFEALARLQGAGKRAAAATTRTKGDARGDVRVLVFGDSHTAADLGTSILRRDLQTRFGDGGRGFFAMGKPFSYYAQDGVRCGMAPPWVGLRGALVAGQVTGDGAYGLAGAAIVCRGKRTSGARSWVDVAASSSEIEVAYLEQPRGGGFDLFIDGARAAGIETRHPTQASAFRSVAVADGPHHVEARAHGDGEVRIFGVAAERPEAGVVVDALGINGARLTTMLTWSERHMKEQLRHRAPDLVVFAYGTNEAGDDTDSATYEAQLVTALGRIARAAPAASCLLVGPPDRASLVSAGAGASDVGSPDGSAGDRRWESMARISEIIASQKRVAAAAGCGFYDQLAAMGGAGSIARWADEVPPRAQHDHVHLTRAGYAELGHAFATELLTAYANR